MEAFVSTKSISKTKIASPRLPERAGDWRGSARRPFSTEELLARISGAMKPADIFEEVWVRVIVDLSWEVLRLRRLKASLMTATAYEGLHKILEPLLESYRERDQLVRGWAARDNTAIKRGSMGSASSSAPLQPMAEPQRIRGPNQSCVIASSFERYTTRVFSAGSSYAY